MLYLDKKTYYVSAFFWKNYNAASKAKMDVERIFQKMGFDSIDLFKDKKNIRVFSIGKLFKLIFTSLFSKKYRHSDVFFQNGTGIDFFLAPILKFIFRKGKRVIVIHDVETIRLGRKIDFIREKSVFSKFTHAVCHSQQMADFLKEELGFKGTVLTLGLFDYIIDNNSNGLKKASNEELPFPNNDKFSIVYAGNLSKWKSGFLHKIFEDNLLFKNYRLVLYGKGFDETEKNECLDLKGAFPPDELPYHLQGHFGLIWDGDDTDKISGNVGKYLKYNSPHKASLYIVSGLPLICWKEAAVFETIKKYNIGFGIDSLKDLDEKLGNISEQEYYLWKSNTIKLKDKLAQGKNLEEIITQILQN